MKQFKIHIAEMISASAEIDKNQVISAIVKPPDESMGDLALPCFIFSKALRKSPNIIAQDFAQKLSADNVIQKIEAQGPYLNFFLNRTNAINSIISSIRKEGDHFGSSDIGKDKTIVIDYSSPNIAKPFGIGHLRSTVIGAALKRIYEFQGYNVVGVNHLGDWGTQFGKLIAAFRLWGDETKLNSDPIGHLFDLYVKIHQEEEKDPSLTSKAREEFKRLEQGQSDNIKLWNHFSELSRKEFDKIYKILGVEFESYAGESFYNDLIPKTQSMLEKSGLLSESREATIVDLEKFGMTPMLIKKSDDTTLYATRDLAAAFYRREHYNFYKMLYVVNVAQSLHFKQLFKVIELLGNDWAKDCYHVSFGWVKLGDEMMSTRKGNTVFLEDVINKSVELAKKIIKENSPDHPNPDETAFAVGVGAVVFTDLAFKRDTDISFDWDRMLDFSGNTGPNLQYVHARICSVIRKYGKPLPEDFDASQLTLPEEFAIAKKLAEYPDIIEKAGDDFEPFIISSFLLELCGLFNTYYQRYRSAEDRILSSNEYKANARLILIDCVRLVVSSGLYILGLKAPKMM